MSLQVRLQELISAIGTDVKDIKTRMLTTDTDQDVFGIKKFIGSGNKPFIQVGPYGTIVGLATSTIIFHNATTSDGGFTFQAINNAGASAIQLNESGTISMYSAPAVAVGATQTFTARFAVTAAGVMSGITALNFTGNLVTSGSITGWTLKAAVTGATSTYRLVGATVSGAPTSGTFAVGDIIIALDTLRLWKCTAAGSPGTWMEQVPPAVIDGGVP